MVLLQTDDTSTTISSSEQRFIWQGCADDCRADGRTCSESRQYSLTKRAPLELSNGSSRLLLPSGETHILCSTKAELVHPSQSQPNQGLLSLHVDTLTSKASHDNEELESVLHHLLSDIIDLKGLCIVPYHYCWRLHIDVMLLTVQGGSVVDACASVILQSLKSTVLPTIQVVEKEDATSEQNDNSNRPALSVDPDIAHAEPIPGLASSALPHIVTVTVLQEPSSSSGAAISRKSKQVLLVDATKLEEACATAQVHVTVYADASSNSNSKSVGAICKSGGRGALPYHFLPEITNLALASSDNSNTVLVQETDGSSFLQDQFQLYSN